MQNLNEEAVLLVCLKVDIHQNGVKIIFLILIGRNDAQNEYLTSNLIVNYYCN